MKHFLIHLFLLMFANALFAQHGSHYSQYMFNKLAINPAFAGSNKALNATVVHRNQWTGFDGAPKTTTLSVHSSLPNKKLNVGLNFVSDKFGVTKKTIVNGIFAYKLQFKKSSLSFGLQGGMDFTANNWDQINTSTSGDIAFEGQRDRSYSPIAGAGVYYLSKNYFVGLSSPSLIRFEKNTKYLYKPLFFNAGYDYKFSEVITFKPSVLIKYISNSPLEADFNLNAYYKEFGVGLSYRTNDAVVLLLNYSINKQFNIGYSYDFTISKLRTHTNGSHELMLRYEFEYKLNAASPRYF